MKNSSRHLLLGLAAAAGLGALATTSQGAGTTPTAQGSRATSSPKSPALATQVETTKAALRYMHGAYTPHHHGYANGPGWSQAQVQRRARKARNVKRNRLAQRR